MIEIVLGVVLFTVIVTCLVGVVLVARGWLVGKGRVSITVNSEREVAAQAGTKLLDALTVAGINLPSACGGVGTCGQCRVRVTGGGGAPLPVETARFTRREISGGMRLACQLALREDTAVEVAEEIFGVRSWQCRVTSNRNVATFIKELTLALPEGEVLAFRAGAYIQITCPPYRAPFAELEIGRAFRAEWERLDLLRLEGQAAAPTTRAYSMANYPGEGNIVMLNIRVALPPPGAAPAVPPGVVSSYLFSLKPGDAVAVGGPYGHFFATESEAEMVFVGGGVGMAPMRAHIHDQLLRIATTRKITFWYGARSRRDLFYTEDFDRLAAAHDNFEWTVALSEPMPEDGWEGETGFIHEVLRDRYLENHAAPEDCEYYLCGPPVMLRALRNMLDSLGVDPDNIFFDEFGV